LVGLTGACFGGAYAWYGSDSPQNFGISKTTLTDDNQGDIGLVVHELLHNLGIGHTQKRQDASEYVEIKWNNINKASHSQYQACVEANDRRCSRYNHYDVEYDCSSIMHYRDYFFITSEARAAGGKTMIAKKANCDLGGYRSTLSVTDIAMLNKMYCKNKPQKNVITSPNYPSNYPDNLDKDFPITVDKGVIELSFTHFKLEPDTICADDWVMVVDADGTTLLDKTCGNTKPSKITSRTKSITIKFHSDGNKNYAGFRAEYKQVESAPKPVNGAWSKWSGYSTCSNGKDGKSACKKKKVRFCNNPPASNGGAECEGNSEKTKACSPTEMSPTENPNCVLTGGWSVWSQYSTCSSSCRATRTRTCNNPAPINSKGCDGDASESSTCSGGECPSKSSGTIQSTNYPSKYPNNDDVTFPLEVEAGSRIQLKFTDFDLESHQDCRFDYVKVVDSDGTTELANLCGAQIPSDIKSSGNKLTVVFHSDLSVNSDGFQARWTKIPGKSSGVIMSPNYPNTYKNSENKIYNLYAPEGSKIELTINELNIEWKDKKNGELTCPYDKLTVYDGPIAPNNKKAELCGSSVDKLPTKSVVSTGNTMTVVFTSDGSVVFKGFKASWKQV